MAVWDHTDLSGVHLCLLSLPWLENGCSVVRWFSCVDFPTMSRLYAFPLKAVLFLLWDLILFTSSKKEKEKIKESELTWNCHREGSKPAWLAPSYYDTFKISSCIQKPVLSWAPVHPRVSPPWKPLIFQAAAHRRHLQPQSITLCWGALQRWFTAARIYWTLIPHHKTLRIQQSSVVHCTSGGNVSFSKNTNRAFNHKWRQNCFF